MTQTKKSMSPLAVVLILSGVFFFLFLVISGAMFMWRSSDGWETHSAPRGGLFRSIRGAVGVVEVKGVIMDSKRILRHLRAFEEDDSIKAVVVRLDSPGGSVAPSQEIYRAVRGYRKPVVASMGSVAASGAFYVAMGAKQVFANPGTITGSIGVLMEFANLKDLYKWAKIERYALTTGKFKNAGADYKDMAPEARKLFQSMIDNVLGQFKAAVAEGRDLKMPEVTKVADGRIFSGEQAKALKLVDELGTLDDAVMAAAKLGGLDVDEKKRPKIVYPRRPRRSFFDLLDFAQDEESEMRSPIERIVGRFVLDRVLGGGRERSMGGEMPTMPVPSLPHLVPGVYWLWDGQG